MYGLKPGEAEALFNKKKFRRYSAKHVEKWGGLVKIGRVEIGVDEVFAWGHCIKHSDPVEGQQHTSYKFWLYEGPVDMCNPSQSNDGPPGGVACPSIEKFSNGWGAWFLDI